MILIIKIAFTLVLITLAIHIFLNFAKQHQYLTMDNYYQQLNKLCKMIENRDVNLAFDPDYQSLALITRKLGRTDKLEVDVLRILNSDDTRLNILAKAVAARIKNENIN